jgi:hypothetical protein
VDVTARPRRGLLLIGGIPLVWLGHLSLGYGLISLHCFDGWLPGKVLGIDAIRLIVLLLTLAVGGYLLLTVATLWRRAGDGEGARFTAFVGTLLACNVGAYLVWSTIPTFVTDLCR